MSRSIIKFKKQQIQISFVGVSVGSKENVWPYVCFDVAVKECAPIN